MTSRREFHPREPQLPPVPGVFEPAARPTYSRWQTGATSFGPRGRIAATALVVLFLGMSFFYILLPLWLILVGTAVAVLRDVWKKVRVLPEIGVRPPSGSATPSAASTPEQIREQIPEHVRRQLWSSEPRAEPVVEPTPGWMVGLRVAGVIALIGISVAWQVSSNTGRAIIGITGSLAALVVALRWFLRS
jgi:hypothetical protein